MLFMDHLWDGLVLTSYGPWFYLLSKFYKPIESKPIYSLNLYLYKMEKKNPIVSHVVL